MTSYSNPRMTADIANWPSGGRCVTAHFSIETHPKRGQRAVRVTTGAPKKLTFSEEMRIVDGDDGKTYIAAYRGFITVYQSNMQFEHETVYQDDPRYPSLLAIFD